MLLNKRDTENMRKTYNDLIQVFQTNNDPTTIVFYNIVRTDNDSSVGRYLDNVSYNVFSEDQGFTRTNITTEVPCHLVPNVNRLSMTDMGYMENSDLEIEISTTDLANNNINVSDITNTYEYATVNYPNEVDVRGRSITTTDQLWYVTSIRPLTIGKDLFGIRVGLSLREADMEELNIDDR